GERGSARRWVPQPDGAAVCSAALAYRRGEPAQLGVDPLEILSRVDIAAVGEMNERAIRMPEPHRLGLLVVALATQDAVALERRSGVGRGLQQEAPALPEELDRIAPEHPIDVVLTETGGEHRLSGVESGEGFAASPVGGGVDQHAIESVLLQNRDHPVRVHLRVWIDGKTHPAP